MRQTRYSSCKKQSSRFFCTGERRQGRQRACGQGFYRQSQGLRAQQQFGDWLRGLFSPNVKRSE
ncbi:hypothetical protein B0537_06360 [Desulforamulus ferrireducens]|uniref:Uncharacterized protein n=1 Tax=Desulforamulus ferrireducens TaxID=1833852 RepID=A0A1S6IVC8_9FIRM|nr:hypothetical protein B0537_06360 [Desulforamulus ferrireducens]